MRIAVMAGGRVGARTLEFLVGQHPQDLVAAVFPTAPEAAAWAARPEGALSLCWDERARLRQLAPDVLLLAWWPYLLRGDDLALAPVVLNMHPSLLPHCRGKDPNFWAIVGQRPFGVSLHHVDASIDGGAVAFQREIAFDWTATGRTLYEAAEAEMLRLFIESYPAIAAGRIPRIAQDSKAGSAHRRAELEPASLIDLDAPTTARQLLNLLRARTFAPWPACRFTDSGETYEARVEIVRLPHGE